MRKALATVLSAAMLLTACGGAADTKSSGSGTSGGTAPAAEGKKEPVTLRVAWWGGQSRHDYTLKVIELYKQKNPHVKIETEYAAFDDYWKKLAPQAAANGLPDVFQMDVSYLSQYGERNQLEDLEPYTKNGLINVKDISENNLSGGKIGGKLVAMNLGSNVLGSTIDPQMLKDAGVTLKQDWTFADWEEVASKLKAKGKMIAADLRHDVYFPFYLRGQGQKMYAADGASLGYTDDKPFIDFYTMYQKWYDAGYLLPLDKLAQKKGTPEDDEMVMGNSASSNGWSNQYILAANAAKRPLEIHPVPGWSQNKALYLKPSMYFSIAKSSKVKEEAAKFVDFFLNDIEANKIIKGERGVPVSSKVKDALMPDLTPEQKKVFEYVAWAEKNSSQMDPPNPVGAVEVDKLLKDTVEQILYKKLSVQDAAAKFRKDANAILAKNKK
ncbi:ABC transporter substrate-binding protein [Paenibacillus sp. GD4]|jgi:multiple sugar transport system substrate-binding protein|uniref:ABC transporter substrate-binding protein n=1 Tax=Paenibacillus sp. GD4 TaxID=3068890 RepID=UPI0027965C05|nr:ABC transporter substrate-binding protein [Paenibacillus sp. GD4]MDQ1913214.1 ABC transporter substrate-binding protein [Paenibacillus sp. GD4]